MDLLASDENVTIPRRMTVYSRDPYVSRNTCENTLLDVHSLMDPGLLFCFPI